MDPYLGEIRITAFNFAPRGWALCNGQILSINQNQALYALLGTTYGGDGRTTFALPDLRGRMPMHVNAAHPLGQSGGEPAHTLTTAEMPTHTHPGRASSHADTLSPAGAYWATQPGNAYALPATNSMAIGAIGAVGGSQPHENMPPYLGMNFVIALTGIFPPRS